MADPARPDRGYVARHPSGIAGVAARLDIATVARIRGTHIEPCLGAREACRCVTCIFNRSPRMGHHHALLRVGQLGLGRRHTEHFGVKLGDAVGKPTPMHVGFPLLSPRVTINRAPIPTPFGWTRDDIAPSHEVGPERFDTVCARECAAHADDCNVRAVLLGRRRCDYFGGL